MESIDLRQYFDTLYLSDVEVHQRTKLRIERLLELRPHVFACRKREFLSFASTSAVGFVCLVHTGHASYFEQTLNSVAASSDRRFRLTVVDNGASTEISHELDRRAALGEIDVLVRLESNLYRPELGDDNPLFDLFTIGALLSDAKYFFPLNSDDFVSPNFVSEMMRLFEDESCVAAGGQILPVDVNGAILEKHVERLARGNTQAEVSSGVEIVRSLMQDEPRRVFLAPGGQLCVDSRILMAHGGHDSVADYSPFFKVVPFGSVGFSWFAHLYWRYHEGQTNHRQVALGLVYFKEYADYPAPYKISALLEVVGEKDLASQVEGYFERLARQNASSAINHGFQSSVTVGLRAVRRLLTEAPVGAAALILATLVVLAAIRVIRRTFKKILRNPYRKGRRLVGSLVRRSASMLKRGHSL